jgi:lauroyl/myristoyl acyltransferase
MGTDSLFFRRLAHFGAARAPLWFARSAPAPIALLMAAFLVRARRAVVDRQRLLYGRRSAAAEYIGATKTLIEYARCLSESLGASRVGAPQPEVEVRGVDEIRALLDSGIGIVVATAHVGPWEGAAAALAQGAQRSVLLVMEEERDPAAARFEDELRQGRGLGVVRLGQSPLAALPVLEHLRAGGIAAMQVDRPTRAAATMEAQLLGRPVEVPEGPFRLAALHTMTTLTGSLLIALATLHGRLTPQESWAAAHVDEAYQASVWGSDAEAEARHVLRKAEFESAAELAKLAR